MMSPARQKEIFYALPSGLRDFVTQVLRLARQPSVLFEPPFLHENRRFKDIHSGKRCFVLCNGPSILREDLKPLKNEICFSVSNFYKHADYAAIQPRYHAVPNVVAHHTDDMTERWFKEMDGKLSCQTLFLGERQKHLVRRRGLFPGRDVAYLCVESGNPISSERNIDLARQIPGVMSAPIMCLMIGLYMGFRELYLLGTDHDWFVTGRYDYFFDRKEMVLKDPAVKDNGAITDSKRPALESAVAVWAQYEGLAKVASAKNARIVNLAQGSYLDVFAFGRLADILSKSR